MRRLAPLCFAALLAGCASAGQQGASPAPQKIPIGPSGGQYSEIDVRNGVLSTTMAAPLHREPDSLDVTAARAWNPLVAAYAEAGIPVTVGDSASLTLGTVDRRIHGRIGREPASRFLSCGDGLTGPNADAYVVRLTVASVLRPAGSSQSTLTTYVSATAKNPGTSGDEIRCSSTGLLEAQIARTTRGKIQ